MTPRFVNEVSRAPLNRRRKLMGAIEKYRPFQLETNDEMQRLARTYVEAKVVPVKKVEDALHVAVATVEGLDMEVSSVKG